MEPSKESLFFFNQDSSCFAMATTDGFRVYNCEPLEEAYRRQFLDGGIGIVEMLYRCQIVALVGGGPVPKWPSSKVMIWDDAQGRCIGELNFRTPARAVRLRRERICVALEHKVLVYNFSDLRLTHSIETASNAGGLLALSTLSDHAVLACPGQHAGQVRVEAFDSCRTKFIQAHNSPLAALALSGSGRVLATASAKGTLIRTWSAADGTRLQELRRGADPARVYCLAFSRGERPDWLAVTSDKGTLHVFALAAGAGSGQGGGGAAEQGSASPSRSANPVSALSRVGAYLPVGRGYFKPERSFVQYRLPDGSRAVVAWGAAPCTLHVLTAAGHFHGVSFDPGKGGACQRLAFQDLLAPGARGAAPADGSPGGA